MEKGPVVVDTKKMLEMIARKGLNIGTTVNSEVLIYTYLTKEEFDSTRKEVVEWQEN